MAASHVICGFRGIRYRKMLFTTPGLSQYISGVIVYDETLRSTCAEGVALVRHLQDQGIVSLPRSSRVCLLCCKAQRVSHPRFCMSIRAHTRCMHERACVRACVSCCRAGHRLLVSRWTEGSR